MSDLDKVKGSGALVLAFTLVIALFATLFYSMSLKWPLSDILQVAGIFVPFVASAVAFYFGNKNSNDLIATERQRADNDAKKLHLIEIDKIKSP